MLSAERRLCGQSCGAPKGVAPQSWARMSAPISPPPERNSSTPSGPEPVSSSSIFRNLAYLEIITRVATHRPSSLMGFSCVGKELGANNIARAAKPSFS